jgi:hypothetical protein
VRGDDEQSTGGRSGSFIQTHTVCDRTQPRFNPRTSGHNNVPATGEARTPHGVATHRLRLRTSRRCPRVQEERPRRCTGSAVLLSSKPRLVWSLSSCDMRRSPTTKQEGGGGRREDPGQFVLLRTTTFSSRLLLMPLRHTLL